jgi:hypothetical protein
MSSYSKDLPEQDKKDDVNNIIKIFKMIYEMKKIEISSCDGLEERSLQYARRNAYIKELEKDKKENYDYAGFTETLISDISSKTSFIADAIEELSRDVESLITLPSEKAKKIINMKEKLPEIIEKLNEQPRNSFTTESYTSVRKKDKTKIQKNAEKAISSISDEDKKLIKNIDIQSKEINFLENILICRIKLQGKNESKKSKEKDIKNIIKIFEMIEDFESVNVPSSPELSESTIKDSRRKAYMKELEKDKKQNYHYSDENDTLKSDIWSKTYDIANKIQSLSHDINGLISLPSEKAAEILETKKKLEKVIQTLNAEPRNPNQNADGTYKLPTFSLPPISRSNHSIIKKEYKTYKPSVRKTTRPKRPANKNKRVRETRKKRAARKRMEKMSK